MTFTGVSYSFVSLLLWFRLYWVLVSLVGFRLLVFRNSKKITQFVLKIRWGGGYYAKQAL